MVGYLYHAEGNRIAKGTIQLVNGQLSCDTTKNSFTLTESYILGPGGQQLTEMKWSGGTASWEHTNVWAAGALIATYSLNGSQTVLNFHFTDWLGTRRVLTDYAGATVQSCASLPFGNGENCAPTPTEHLFTQKQRDVETGNDYFGARYYSSLSGRFLTPDWSAKVEPVPYAKLDNPQSLNLYAYVGDNPLSGTDPDGHFGFGFLSGLWAAITGNEAGNLTGTEEFAAVNLRGTGAQQTNSIDESQTTQYMGRGRGGHGKGERKRAAKPSGTDDADKHFHPDPNRPGWLVGKDQNGKTIYKPDPNAKPAAPEPERVQKPGKKSLMEQVNDWLNENLPEDVKQYLRYHPYGPNSRPGPYVSPVTPTVPEVGPGE